MTTTDPVDTTHSHVTIKAPTTAELVANAESALAMLDNQIADRRQSKADLSAEIAQLLEDRKPLARIVSAAKGRQPKANGDG